MAKAYRKTKDTNPTLPAPVRKGQEQLVINQIQFRSIDLTPKDIGKWAKAWEAAISVYYPNRTRLYDVYAKILNDTHLHGIVSKRVGAVTNGKWIFEKNGRKDNAFDDLIRSARFREVIGLCLWTKMWGQSGLEFIPGKEFDFKEIPRRHIKQKWQIIAENEQDCEGINYTDLPNVWVLGKPDDIGLLNKCAPMVIYKSGNWGDWAQYIEVFGQPMRIFRYDAYDPQGKKEIQEAAAMSGGSLALTIPKQAEFDVKDGKASNGDGRLQDTFRNAINAELSVCILGNTETTLSSHNSGYAQSRIHSAQQELITLEDIEDAENMLNDPHFLAILQTYGYDTTGGRFSCQKIINLQQVKDQVDIINILRRMGTPVADDHIYEITGIPKPDDYEALKKITAGPANLGQQDNIPAMEPADKPVAGKNDDNTHDPLHNLSVNDNQQTLLQKIRTAITDFFGDKA